MWTALGPMDGRRTSPRVAGSRPPTGPPFGTRRPHRYYDDRVKDFPKTPIVVVLVGGASGDVTLYLRSTDPSAPTQRVLLGRGVQATMTAPDGRADFSVCGKILPRDNDGTQWFLEVVTVNKAVNASVVVDVLLQPFPDATTNDSDDPGLERPQP